MARHRRRGVLEINLTSLLDVLFCILFIVMLTGERNEENIKDSAQQEIKQLQEQIDFYEKQVSSCDIYNNQAIIVTISNVQEGKTRKLMISDKADAIESDAIQLGINRIQRTNQFIENKIIGLIDITDNQPIYIVFHCDRDQIYTSEYNSIIDTLTNLQSKNKEVFFKVVGIEE